PRWIANGAGGPRWTVRAVKQKIPFFDCPTVISANHDAVNFLNIVLADVGENQVAIGAVEAKAIRVAQPVSIGLPHLAGRLEWVADRDPVLPVRADRIGTGGRQGGSERVKPQHFPQRRAEVLGIPTRL